tara:strand:+ start:891 stop:2054 length:1164 start_codon:yes stop_codon:yes gene_type:complete
MPYLGNTPTANFASVTKDTFSGNGSTTAFTLSKPATTNGVAVYVENVRQIPTTAYAVSGTTLTFTGAPVSGTNNIYVMHHNTPVSTATHPSAQALTATSGTFSSTLAVTGATTLSGGVSGDVNVDSKLFNIDSSNDRIGINTNSIAENDAAKMTINADNTGAIIINNTGQTNDEFAPILFTSHATSAAYPKQGIGVKRTGDFGVGDLVFAVDSNADAADVSMTNDAKMTISQAGYITMPNQPSISVDGDTSPAITDSGSSSYTITEWTTTQDSVFYSQGITFDDSNGRFTVPVAGKYLVNVSIYLYQHLRFQRVQIYVNGNNKLHFTFDTRFNSNNLGQDISLSGSTILNLSASDYVSFHMYKVSSESDKRYFIGAQHSHASMHLLS